MACPKGCCPDLKTHLRSLNFAPSTMPTRAGGQAAADMNRKDKVWGEDQDAYKRLRKNGLQPNTVDGAAVLEKHVTDQVDIDMGAVVPKKHRNQMRDILQEGALNRALDA